MVACTPHPGLGTVAIQRPAIVRVVDLASCRVTTERPAKPAGGPTIVVRRTGKAGTQSIVFDGRMVLTVHESFARIPAGSPGPIELKGISPDRRWILYAIDPMGSASLAADGLTLQAVSTTGGRSRTVASGLLYSDYRAWCDFRTLVITAGGDRIATNNKRLVVTGPPTWRPHLLVHMPTHAFGSVVCAPDGESVVVQSQPQSADGSFFHTRWHLQRIWFYDGAQKTLTHPPLGYADESPHFSPDERTIYFVRSKRGIGELYALRAGKLVGPLLSLGYSMGYYGANAWPYTVRR